MSASASANANACSHSHLHWLPISRDSRATRAGGLAACSELSTSDQLASLFPLASLHLRSVTSRTCLYACPSALVLCTHSACTPRCRRRHHRRSSRRHRQASSVIVSRSAERCFDARIRDSAPSAFDCCSEGVRLDIAFEQRSNAETRTCASSLTHDQLA